MSEPVAGDLFGRYHLERQLGSGGMGAVWLARPPGPAEAPVVIKVLHSHLAEDERSLRRFLDETRLARLLRHPNLVEFLEGGQQGCVHFMAMEFVDGLQLRQCLTACGGPLAPALAAALFAQACAGLEYAHALADEGGHPLQLVHRDVAPDNLMVDRQGRVKLVDFGIARTTHTDLTTKTGDRRGKVRYVAPEYIKGGEATARSDVYSMGATLFEVCTGKRPFDEVKNLMEIANAIVNQGLPAAGALHPALPAELSAIIATATQRDPDCRYPSAAMLEQALRRFLASHPAPTSQQIGRQVVVWMERLGIKSAQASVAPQPAPAARPPSAPASVAAAGRMRPAGDAPAETAEITVRSVVPLVAAPQAGHAEDSRLKPVSSEAATIVSEIAPLVAAACDAGAARLKPEAWAPGSAQSRSRPDAGTACVPSSMARPAPRRAGPPVDDFSVEIDIDLDSGAILPQAETSLHDTPALGAPAPLASVVIDESLLGGDASAPPAVASAPKGHAPGKSPARPAAERPAPTVIVSEELVAQALDLPTPPKPKGRR